MPSDLETCMETLIRVFHRYASKEGNSATLNRRELRLLMENELANFLRVRDDSGLASNFIGHFTPQDSCCWRTRFTPLFFLVHAVSEGPGRRGQDHEGPGRQRRRPGGLWGVCFSGCWTVHCLWAVLSDALEENGIEVTRRVKKNGPAFVK